ncbi:MAG: metalloregulator ArsR/SmtB family transcription factor [Micromonosporaceae bacterium]|mgnify:CR=1 FL=1
MTKQAGGLQLLGPACCAPLTREPLTPEQAEALAPMFKALGDPVRLRLLSLIASHAGGEVCVCDLTPRFALTAPTISHHLRVLREAGLIDCERRGTWVYYWVNPGVLDRLAGVLTADGARAAEGRPAGAAPGPAGGTSAGATDRVGQR